MTELKFKNRKPNREKLLDFGFECSDAGYVYGVDLIGGLMKLTVKTDAEGNIYTEVTDNNSGDEYVLHRMVGATGAFVGQIKTEYENIMDEIAATCFDVQVFKSEQARAVIDYVREKYGDELEYLWQKFPDNAIVRRKDNRKWYAALLTVSRKKLGFDSGESVEILDIRAEMDEIKNIVDNVRYFPGYHMSKKHWITICLDGMISNEEIFSRIDKSYVLVGK